MNKRQQVAGDIVNQLMDYVEGNYVLEAKYDGYKFSDFRQNHNDAMKDYVARMLEVHGAFPNETEPKLQAKFYYMKDNFTFVEVDNHNDFRQITRDLKYLAEDNPYGMVCPVIIMQGDKELRRVGVPAHSNKDGDVDLTEWAYKCMQDDFLKWEYGLKMEED